MKIRLIRSCTRVGKPNAPWKKGVKFFFFSLGFEQTKEELIVLKNLTEPNLNHNLFLKESKQMGIIFTERQVM